MIYQKILLFFIFQFFVYAEDDFALPKQLLRQHKIKEAIEQYKQIGINKNLEAFCELGKLYYKGKYIKKDIQKAMDYFQLCATNNNKKALYNIAALYSSKQYKNYNPKKSFELFLSLAQDGYAKAQYKVANAYLVGWGVQKDYKLAMAWFEEALFSHNHILSGCSLGYMYANGLGALQNLGRARNLALAGYKQNLPLCKKVFKDFKLYKPKYKQDKGFKSKRLMQYYKKIEKLVLSK